MMIYLLGGFLAFWFGLGRGFGCGGSIALAFLWPIALIAWFFC